MTTSAYDTSPDSFYQEISRHNFPLSQIDYGGQLAIPRCQLFDDGQSEPALVDLWRTS